MRNIALRSGQKIYHDGGDVVILPDGSTVADMYPKDVDNTHIYIEQANTANEKRYRLKPSLVEGSRNTIPNATVLDPLIHFDEIFDPNAGFVTTNVLDLTNTILTSTVNGVADTVDLASIIPADKYIADADYDPNTNIITFTYADGTTDTVDLTPLSADKFVSTFDLQNNILTVTWNDATTTTVDFSAYAVDKFLNPPTFDPATNIITFTWNDGQSSTINLSVLDVDRFLANASYDNATNELVLTVQDQDGNPLPEIRVPLTDLIPVTPDGTTITGTGTTADPIKAGNLVDNNDGTYTWTSATGTNFNIDTNIVVTTDDPTGVQTLTVDGTDYKTVRSMELVQDYDEVATGAIQDTDKVLLWDESTQEHKRIDFSEFGKTVKNFHQNNTGSTIPATLVDPTSPAIPKEGDETIQQYDNGLVFSVYQNGAWVNTETKEVQPFQIDGCDENEGLIDTDGYTFQVNSYNAQNAPLTWSVDSFTGDIENANIDTNGLVTYDVPAIFTNNGKSEVVVTATDSIGAKVSKKFCLKAKDPIVITSLACNNTIATNRPDIVAQTQLFALVDEQYAFTDAGKTTNAGNGDNVEVIEDIAGNGDLTVSANSNTPQFKANEPLANNRDVLVFDSSNNESIFLYNASSNLNDTFKLAIYFKLDTTTGANGALLAVGSSAGGDDALNSSVQSWQISRGAGGTANEFVFRYTNTSNANVDAKIEDFATIADGQFHFLFAEYDGTEIKIFVDGVLKLTENLGGRQIYSNHFRLFRNRAGANFVSGELGEIIIAGSGVTQTQSNDIQAYFLCKYGLDASAFSEPGPFTIDQEYYPQLSQFELQYYSNGTQQIYDTINNNYFAFDNSPTPGLGYFLTDQVNTIINSNSNISTDYGVTGDGTSANPLKLELGVARVTVNNQAGINNSTAGVNVSFGATTIDTIGVTTGGGGIVLPTGLYEIEFRPTIQSTVQRSNLGWRILLDGTAQLAGNIGGMNYARSQSGHNETGDFIKDFVEITNPTGVVSIQGFRQAQAGANVNLVGNASILLIKRLA
jgi:hypothetical protein